MGGPSAVRSSQAPETNGAEAGADDAALELLDVPAAVVCAFCGSPDCQGCSADDNQASGVIAIVPWERPGQRLPSRLLSTARLATTSSESFFGALPEGDAAAAMRFAVLAELLAVVGLLLSVLPVLLIAAPWLLRALIHDIALRDAALRALSTGVPGLAFAMVAIHAAHGLGLDWGAKRQGATTRRGRGLRFGLYSCGWDLLTLPLGIAMTAVAEGPRRALATAALGLSVPNHAARAYLRGVHRLGDKEARAASRFALWVASVVILVVMTTVALVTLLR
jgi:hypothetical protein